MAKRKINFLPTVAKQKSAIPFFLLSFYLLLCSSGGKAQNSFNYSDSIFEVGQTLTSHDVRFDLNKPDLLFDEVSQPVLDSMLLFLQNHPELRVEIGVHTDARGQEYRSFVLTESRARSLYAYFVDLGAGKTQIVPIGYEHQNPIHHENYIEQFKTTDREKYEQLRRENRRVVLTILEINTF